MWLNTLLDQHTQATAAAERKELEGRIYEVVDRHFRQAIRGWLAAKYGRGLKDDRHGQGASYTALFHDFFVKVLEQKPDPFWKAKTASDLRSWSSVVMLRMLVDHYRRTSHRPVGMDGFEEFANQRETHFERRFPGLVWVESLKQWQRWQSQGTDTERQWARILAQHYVDGMKWCEIATDLEISSSAISKLKTRAVAALRLALRQTLEDGIE